jgi:hypothetical protein
VVRRGQPAGAPLLPFGAGPLGDEDHDLTTAAGKRPAVAFDPRGDVVKEKEVKEER